jgi:nicotinamide riboside transporter PnuC
VTEALYWLLVQQSAWISGAISVVMTWQMGNRRWWAPFLGLVGQLFWALLAWFTNQPGLMLTVAIYTFVHARNGYKWWSEERCRGC